MSDANKINCILTVQDRLDSIPKIRKSMSQLEIQWYAIAESEYNKIQDLMLSHFDTQYPGNSYLPLLMDRMEMFEKAEARGNGNEFVNMYNQIAYEISSSLLDYLISVGYV